MSANNILTFGALATTEMSQAAYLASSQRTNGNQPGIADPLLVNKALHQLSTIAAGVGQYMADRQNTDIVDTLTPAQVATALDFSVRPGSYKDFQTISATTTLTAAQAGAFLSITASAIVTLPAASAVPLGATYILSQTGAGATATVQAGGGDSLFALGSSTPRTFTLGGGDSIKIVKVSANSWYAFDGVQLGFAASFLGTFSTAGYQKLPSGTIFQRGSYAASAGGDTPTAFPIAFPNFCRQIIVTPQITTTGIFAGYNSATTSGFNGNAWVSSTTRANATVDFLAIGY